VNVHEKKTPLKKFTPMIAKISRNKRTTISTFAIAGIAANRALTITFNPSFREIILSGLSAHRALNALSDLRLTPPPALMRKRSIKEAPTTRKSS
jgi:hypothetical protein